MNFFVANFTFNQLYESHKVRKKMGFIKRVDKGWITTVKDLESWRFERLAFVRANDTRWANARNVTF